MRAAVLHAFGSPLAIETLPDPVLGTGEIIVDVAAAGVASYTEGVLSGARKYPLEVRVVSAASARRGRMQPR
jgi:alcohol dehydrogenase